MIDVQLIRIIGWEIPAGEADMSCQRLFELTYNGKSDWIEYEMENDV